MPSDSDNHNPSTTPTSDPAIPENAAQNESAGVSDNHDPPTTPTSDPAIPENAAQKESAGGKKSRKGVKGKKTDSTREKKKRGNPGAFSPKRVAYMKAALPLFMQHRDKNTKKRRGSGQSFWDEFFPAFWTKFPWRSARNEDPLDDPAELEALAREPEDDAEMEAKKKMVTETEQKVIWWFSRQRVAQEQGQNPWKDALKELRVPQGSAPRRLSDWQFYEQHEDFKDKLEAEFQARGYNARPAKEHLNLRGQIARELLEKESDDVIGRIHREAEEQHAEAVAQHQEDLEGKPSPDPEVQAESRRRFAAVLKPMLDLVQAYSGYQLTLLAARVDTSSGRTEVMSTSVHAGVTIDTPVYKDFSRADPARYKEVMTLFSRFVVNSYLAENQGSNDPAVNPATTNESTAQPAQANPASTDTDITNPRQHGGGSPGEDSIDDHAATNANALMHSADSPIDNGNIDVEMEFPSSLLPVSRPAPSRAPATTPAAPATVAEALTTPPEAPATMSASDPLGHMRRPPGPHLRAELLAMPINEREDRIARMRIFSSYEMEREENIARNKALLVSLGLGNATTWAGAGGKKRKGKSAGGQKKKQKGDVEAGTNDSDDEDEDEADEGDASPPPIPRPPRPTRGKGSETARAITNAAVKNQWAVAAREQLERTELGEPWKTLLSLWYSREELLGFASPRESHKVKKRPAQVGEWVARGRSPRYKPSISDPAKFGEQWRIWWVDINPTWRKSVNGELIRAGSGEWDGLDIPGANGFLNVVICLKWWADAVQGAPGDKWDDAVADVTWVLHQLLRANAQTTSDGNATDNSTEGPALLGQQSVLPADTELSPEELAEMRDDPEAEDAEC